MKSHTMNRVLVAGVVAFAFACGGGTSLDPDALGTDDTVSTMDILVDLAIIEADTAEISDSECNVLVSPGTLLFVSQEPGDTVTVELTISNKGKVPVDLLSSTLFVANMNTEVMFVTEFGVNLGTKLSDLPEIEPDGSHTFRIVWDSASYVPKNDRLGSVHISTNDPCSPIVAVEMLWVANYAFPRFIPGKVDFGPVGPGVTTKRTLKIVSLGSYGLTVNPDGGCLVITGDQEGEFGFEKAANGWGPSDPVLCDVGEIKAGSEQSVVLTYTNKASTPGKIEAGLGFVIKDFGAEDILIGLVAERVPGDTCAPALVPSTLDFGSAPAGELKELGFQLVNQGTGSCTFKKAIIENCENHMGTGVNCGSPQCMYGIQSNVYQFTSVPPAVKDGIGPGDHVPLDVAFVPYDIQSSVFGILSQPFLALASVCLQDLKQQKFIVIPPLSPDVGSISGYPPNITGEVENTEPDTPAVCFPVADFMASVNGWSYGCPFTVAVGSTIDFYDASYAQAGRTIEAWEWTVTKPAGSQDLFQPNPSFSSPSFTFSGPGDYLISLEVVDSQGKKSCEPRECLFTAEKPVGCIVELTWSTPADSDPTNQCGAGLDCGSDMDLHVVHPNASGPDIDMDGKPDGFFDTKYDCFWFNPFPVWNEESGAGPLDQPQFTLDDSDGAGPEIFQYDFPEPDKCYRVGVHYWDDHGFGASYPTIKMFIDGDLVYDKTATKMVNLDMWEVGEACCSEKDTPFIEYTMEDGVVIIDNYVNPEFIITP